MQTVKDLPHKCKESGQDLHLAMLCLCSTPLSHDLPSPAELLNVRVYQTNLPAVSKPLFSADGDINVKLQLRQDMQKAQYDKTAQQPRFSLIPEDNVRVFNPASGTWMPGIVKHVADTPRSYLVATEKSGTLWRNHRNVCATGKHFQLQSDEVPDDVPVDKSTSCAADPGEHSISKAPTFPTSAACSPAEPPKSVLQSTTADPSPVQPLCGSNKTIKALDRLNL